MAQLTTRCFEMSKFNPWLNSNDINQINLELNNHIGRWFMVSLKMKKTDDKIFNNLISIELLN